MGVKRLRPRQKELLIKAFDLMEKRIESLKAGVEELGLSAMVLDTALGHTMAAKAHVLKAPDGKIALASSGIEDSFRTAARGALAYNVLKLAKLEKSQTDLFVPTSETRETIEEVENLRELFGSQFSFDEEIEDTTTVEVTAGGKSSGRMSMREFERRTETIGAQPTL